MTVLRVNSPSPMLFRLFLLFVILPLMELFLLFKIADWTSSEFTILLVVVTGLVGSVLARTQGFRTYRRIRDDLGSGRMPGDALLDAVMILIAGALLLTPGVMTDLFGFSLLIPVCRQFYRAALKSRFSAHFTVHAAGLDPHGSADASRSTVIDSYVVGRDEDETGEK